ESGCEPIVPVLLEPRLVIDQIIVVLVIVLLCLLYPISRLLRLPVASALKGGMHAS
ncbi:ABC transporter permease, partial [Vibrio astriarenae]